jgi:hypothetical protein
VSFVTNYLSFTVQFLLIYKGGYMFGDNIITRTADYLSIKGSKFLHDYLHLHPNFLKGVLSGFGTAFCYNKYVEPIFKELAPHTATAASQVVQTVQQETSSQGLSYDLRSLAAPLIVALYGDDHFLCGTLVGMGAAFAMENIAITGSLIAIGAACEWYYSDLE